MSSTVHNGLLLKMTLYAVMSNGHADYLIIVTEKAACYKLIKSTNSISAEITAPTTFLHRRM